MTVKATKIYVHPHAGLVCVCNPAFMSPHL